MFLSSKIQCLFMKKIEKIMVYFPEDIAKKLKQTANRNTRSISGQVVHYVKQGLKIDH
tara:strand:+ start:613 stop:786 length:174 start_codon:yes stop_codon:yes gene_type:complete